MQPDDLTIALTKDFDALSAHFDADGFMKKMRRQLDQRQRAKTGFIGIAGIVGAALAATQFQNLMDFAFLAPFYESMPDTVAGNISTLVPSLILAGAVVATTLVIRREA